MKEEQDFLCSCHRRYYVALYIFVSPDQRINTRTKKTNEKNEEQKKKEDEEEGEEEVVVENKRKKKSKMSWKRRRRRAESGQGDGGGGEIRGAKSACRGMKEEDEEVMGKEEAE